MRTAWLKIPGKLTPAGAEVHRPWLFPHSGTPQLTRSSRPPPQTSTNSLSLSLLNTSRPSSPRPRRVFPLFHLLRSCAPLQKRKAPRTQQPNTTTKNAQKRAQSRNYIRSGRRARAKRQLLSKPVCVCVPVPAGRSQSAERASLPSFSFSFFFFSVLTLSRASTYVARSPRLRVGTFLRVGARCRPDAMSSAAGGYGGGAERQHHLLLGQAAGQLYHVPQHSRREKLRFPPDHADSSPPPGSWPPPPAPFYSYASSSSSYSPHSPTLAHAHAQLVAHGLPGGAQIPNQNFALSLSSASSNPPPPPRRQLGGGGGATGPYGPFTGYAAVLGRSRFLGPAQKLLEEICDVGGRPAQVDRGSDDGLLDMDVMDAGDVGHEMDGSDRAAAEAVTVCGAEQQRKSRLIPLMEDVCKRYKQYYQQLQAVISSFETVAGLSNAAPFASMALRTMSKHFKYLKSMILSQLRNTSKVAAKDGLGKEDVANFGLNVNSFSQSHNIWRPQRGLPERAVSVLRAWLFEHFLHPYPTDSDKQMLAKQTGLTRNQVSNWFINARVRLWKPMVEEIHNLEMRQLQKNSSLDKNQLGMQQNQHSSDSSGKPSDPSNSHLGQSSGMTRNHSTPASSRHIQNELPHMPHDIPGQVSFPYNGLAAHHSIALSQPQQVEGVGVGVGSAANGGGVSLTLGLHQNNRAYMAEPLPSALPLNLAHRFGLEDVSDAYVMGSFGGQDRHFTKEIGGHLLHDFVG